MLVLCYATKVCLFLTHPIGWLLHTAFCTESMEDCPLKSHDLRFHYDNVLRLAYENMFRMAAEDTTILTVRQCSRLAKIFNAQD